MKIEYSYSKLHARLFGVSQLSVLKRARCSVSMKVYILNFELCADTESVLFYSSEMHRRFAFPQCKINRGYLATFGAFDLDKAIRGTHFIAYNSATNSATHSFSAGIRNWRSIHSITSYQLGISLLLSSKPSCSIRNARADLDAFKKSAISQKSL